MANHTPNVSPLGEESYCQYLARVAQEADENRLPFTEATLDVLAGMDDLPDGAFWAIANELEDGTKEDTR